MELELDLHGKTTKEVLSLLQDLDTFHQEKQPQQYKFITGRGSHSQHRPTMDYFCEQEWKCPLKKTVLDYLVHQKKQGARITEHPTYILWKPRPSVRKTFND